MKSLNSEYIHKILLVSFSNIGDAVLSLPVLNVLSQRFPKAKIDVLVGPRALMVFEGNSKIHSLMIYDKSISIRKRWSFFTELKAKKYNLVVDLKRTYFSFLGEHRTPFFFRGWARHKRDQHLKLLQNFGIIIDESQKLQSLSGPTASDGSSVIVIAPGAMSQVKQWSLDRFARLADKLIDERGVSVIWIGDSRDRSLVSQIQQSMHNSSQNMAGNCSWKESVELIRSSSLVITNDSAPLHVADHYQKKVLVFFGPTDPRKYGSQSTPEGIIFRHKFCSPCEKAQCRYNRECLNDISVEEAFKRAVHLLDDGLEKKNERILVIRLDRMGDLLLSFPAIKAIRNRFRHSNITWLTRTYTQDLAERNLDIDDVLVYDYGKKGSHNFPFGYFRLLKEIISRRYDIVFVLHPTFRSHLLCFLAGIPYRVGYRTRGGFLLTHKIADLRSEGYQHESDNALDVVRAFGVPIIPKEIQFSTYKNDERQAEELMSKNNASLKEDYIVFHASSSSPSKCWPSAHFIDLAIRIRQELGIKVVLVGQETNHRLHDAIQRNLGSDCVDLQSQTPFSILSAIFKFSKCVVSNDSGPAHLASAVGSPVISIFGRNQKGLSSKRWKPIGPNSQYIQKDVGCVICLADDCPIQFECLKSITPEEIMTMIHRQVTLKRALTPPAV